MENYMLALERLKKKRNACDNFRDVSVLESNQHMLEKQVNSDTIFALGGSFGEPREIGAHRYILISRSPVFAHIFAKGKKGVLEGDEILEEERIIGDVKPSKFGGLAAKEYQKTTFILPEIQADAFMELLRYLYYEKCTLNETTAIAIYYAASKFKISALQEMCSIYIRENIEVDAENVIEMLDKSTIYKCHHFSEQCVEFIDSNPSISQSEEFKNLTKPVVYGAMLYMDEQELKEQRAAIEQKESTKAAPEENTR